MESLQPNGMGVGLDSGETFNSSLEEVTLNLKNNDLFFFYSDGITEAMNVDNNLFGQERVEDILLKNNSKTVSEIQTIILDELHNYCGEVPQYDDITLVTVKCKF
jgi:sigma-B regulation protein RsbU (phosphoserine phosphatase)